MEAMQIGHESFQNFDSFIYLESDDSTNYGLDYGNGE